MSRAAASDRLSRGAGIAASLWGAALLTAGHQIWYVVDGRPPTGLDEAAVRFLGARHLTQGVVQAVLPSRFHRLYVAVDVTHAASMFVLAAVDERRRRPAVASGAVALTSALVTLAARRSRTGAATGDGSRPVDGGSRPRPPVPGT